MYLLGQQENQRYFETAIANSLLHHCYLIHGKKGTGKKTFVKELAKFILCGSWDCTCRICRNIDSNNHPDVNFFSSEDSIVKLETVNEFKKASLYSPLEGKRKIVILDGVDRLNVQGANKLLTLIEEPPPYLTIFLLSDNVTKVITTIKSRAIPIMMKPLSKNKLSEYLEKNNQLQFQEAEIVADFCEGSLGQALQLIETDFISNRKTLYDLLCECNNKGTDYIKISSLLENVDINITLDLLEFWVRDLMYLKFGQNKHILINKDYYDKLININVNDPEKIMKKIKLIRNSLKHSINSMLNLEVVFNALQEV